jgi:hypothetical protein
MGKSHGGISSLFEFLKVFVAFSYLGEKLSWVVDANCVDMYYVQRDQIELTMTVKIDHCIVPCILSYIVQYTYMF